MKSAWKYILSLALIGWQWSDALADAPPPHATQAVTDPDSVLSALRTRYPATQFSSVKKTPLPGIFEVVMGGTVAYMGADTRHFLFGHLFDMATMKDLTAQVKNSLPGSERIDAVEEPIRVAPNTLPPLNDAKTTVYGNGIRKVLVFSDPKCPYCRQLDSEFAKVGNVTVHTFLVPILPGSLDDARQLWCGNATPCSTPFDRNLAAMEKLRIAGTPTLISPCGHVRPGAMSAPALDDWLNSAHKVCTGGQS